MVVMRKLGYWSIVLVTLGDPVQSYLPLNEWAKAGSRLFFSFAFWMLEEESEAFVAL